MNLIFAGVLVFLLNIPFGYWRAHLPKLSFWWFASIHIPIPFVVWVRYGFDIGFALSSYPLFIFTFFSGQYLGGFIKKKFFQPFNILPEIRTLEQKLLIGRSIKMSLKNNKTKVLWQTFMPRRKEIKTSINTDLISMQVYSNTMDIKNSHQKFEKWATVEVSDFNNIPKGMDTFVLETGEYAVFKYRGLSTDNRIFKYIFEEWLPKSKYEIDNRPHFEILGEKYKNGDPKSEEEIWIPIKKKTL